MLKNKRILLTILVTLSLLLVPSITNATEESASLPEFTDYSNAKFEIVQPDKEASTGVVALKITGIDEKTILDYRAQYNQWGYYYFVTPDNTKPEITYENGMVKSINGNEDLDYYLVAPISIYNEEEDCLLLYDAGFSFNEKKTINGTAELNQDLYLWIIQTIWDEEFNYTTEFVVNGQELKRPNYSKKIDFYMSDSYGVSIRLHHPMFTENRKFDVKIGKINDETILNNLKNNDSYSSNKLLNYAKSNSSIFSDNLQSIAFSYNTEQEVLFDGATLLEDEAYYYIYILVDDENGKYYPFEAAVPAKATVYDGGWYLKAEDVIINNNEEQPTPEPETQPTHQPEGEPTPEPEAQPTPQPEKKPTNQPETEKKTGDNTIAPGTMPYTGGTFVIIASVLAIVVMGIYAYKRNKDLRGI